MPVDGHCLFHGLGSLTFRGATSDVCATQMRTLIADFMQARHDEETAARTDADEGSWTTRILMQSAENPGPTGRGGCLSQVDTAFVRGYILEMRTGLSTLSRCERGNRTAGWGGHIEMLAWVELMSCGAFQEVPGECSRHYNGLEIFEAASIIHPVSGHVWSPPVDASGGAWFRIVARHPDRLQSNSKHIASFAAVEFEAGSHFNVLVLQGPERFLTEWQAETISLVGPSRPQSPETTLGLDDVYLPMGVEMCNPADFPQGGQHLDDAGIRDMPEHWSFPHSWRMWGISESACRRPVHGGDTIGKRLRTILESHPRCLKVPARPYDGDPAYKFATTRSPHFRPVKLSSFGHSDTVDVASDNYNALLAMITSKVKDGRKADARYIKSGARFPEVDQPKERLVFVTDVIAWLNHSKLRCKACGKACKLYADSSNKEEWDPDVWTLQRRYGVLVHHGGVRGG